jgi:hypothetical protein
MQSDSVPGVQPHWVPGVGWPRLRFVGDREDGGDAGAAGGQKGNPLPPDTEIARSQRKGCTCDG